MALDVGTETAHARGRGDAPTTASGAGGWRDRRHLRWLVPLALVLFAGVLRFAWLSHPERVYFDETYYAKNARQVLEFGAEADYRVGTDPTQGVEPEFVVHPPVGKWLIGAGIAAFGDDSFGWRVAPAVAGTGLVLVTYIIGLRLFRRRGIAALAAFLLAIEGLAFTMSRISMLDVFLALFVAVGAWLLLVDRDRRWAAANMPPGGHRHRTVHVGADGAAADVEDDAAANHDTEEGWAHADGDTSAAGSDDPGGDDDAGATDGGVAAEADARPHAERLPGVDRSMLWLAGVALGLALATKWSAVLAIGGAGLFLLGSELAWRRAVTGRRHRQLPRLVALGVGALVVVPAVVYVASYGAWFANYEHTRPGVAACSSEPCDAGPVDIARGWFGEQQEIYRFHRDLDVTHNYRAAAALWPLTRRPVVYYYESCPPDRADDAEPCAVAPGNVEEILGLGNPAIWWLTLPAYPLLVWAAVRRRDPTAAAISVFLFSQYVPWLGPSRPLFFFYALPLVPFVVLTLVWAGDRAGRYASRRWSWPPRHLPLTLTAVAAAAAFVYFAPVYYGWQISEQAWRARMWLQSWI